MTHNDPNEGMEIQYSTCEDVKRLPPEIIITKEIVDAISSGYRVLPTFEKSLYDYNYKKYYSLEKNEFLKCRFAEFQRQRKKLTPLQFPTNRDDHFYKYAFRLAKDQSIHNKSDFKYKLGPGPGVDFRGQQKPIPNELLMNRSTGSKDMRNKPTRSSKNELDQIKSLKKRADQSMEKN